MSMLQLTALARRVACSNPEDSAEQREIRDRLKEILRSLDREKHEAACESLDGAVLLLDYTSKQGSIGGGEVLKIVERLVNSAHQSLGDEPVQATREPGRGIVLKGGNADAANVIGDMLLGEIMLKRGRILPDHVDQALRVCRSTGMLFGEALVKIGAATWQQVEESLKYQDSCRNLVQGISERRHPGSSGPIGERKITLKMQSKEETDEKGLRLMSDVLFGDVLVRNKIVTQEQLDHAIKTRRATGSRLGEELVNLGYCSWTDVDYALQLQGQMRRYAS